jgi:negative modulator of initiation of replication
MKTIEIEEDLYKYILNNIQAFGETPSQILRRLLVLPEQGNTAKQDNNETISTTSVQDESLEIPHASQNQQTPVDSETNTFVNESVAELFEDPSFKVEPVITNKFMMLLTTMYFEKQAEFVDAAEKTKGRTRAYLGTGLDELLNTDNEEELAQFKASKPRVIPNTPFWVITNANTGRKRIILTQMMASMGYPHHLIERIKEEI